MEDAKIKCPRCGSDQLTTAKKGFSGKKAVVGGILTGGIGILAGTIGSNKIKVYCINCGHSWIPAVEYKKAHSAAAERDFKKEYQNLYDHGQQGKAIDLYKDYYGKLPDNPNSFNEQIKQEQKYGWIGIIILVLIIWGIVYSCGH